MGGGCQAESSENPDEGKCSADWTQGLDPYREVHEPQVAQFLVRQGTRSAEGHGSDCAYGAYSLGPQVYLVRTLREKLKSASMGNVRHRRKGSAVGSVWRTRGTVAAPEERTGSAELREDGDGEDLEPVAEVSAAECPDRD
jgi:hypothetical protein